MKPKLVILFPKVFTDPAGGAKIVLDYANRLSKDEFDITIIYAAAVFWGKRSFRHKIRLVIKYFYNLICGYSCKKWFPLDESIREIIVPSLSWKFISIESAIYIATAAETAMYLNEYPIDSKLKNYFIQGYESWGLTEEILRKTYHFDMKKIVVSKWLSSILSEEGVEHQIIPNGFDFNYFKLTTPPEERNNNTICMMYNPLYLKGFDIAYKAVTQLSQEYSICVNVFGVFERPDYFPRDFNYHRSPNQETHNRIYNSSAIFIGSSLEEGWGLPVGEAMICGCAVLCTDIKGYREMASPDNAVIVPPNDSESIYSALKLLLSDPQRRIRLANKANSSIQSFSIESSYSQLKTILDNQAKCLFRS